jgi:uncharacterized membrane protein
VSEQVEEVEEQRSEEELRNELYDQFDLSQTDKLAIEHIIQRLERHVDIEERHDINPRSKILSEIALYQAYRSEPKFETFAWAGALLLGYDVLHTLNPTFYGIVFVGLATVNGFISSLRSPSMMAAELEGETDENGMPANYRAKAIESVNTNITMVLFGIAFSIQFLVTSSLVTGDLITRNLADGLVNPYYTAVAFFVLSAIYYKIRE